MLNIKNLYKRLGNFQLTDINLDIKQGEYFVILGPTGTGKTVVLETIAGMYHPDKGSIYFNDENFSNLCVEKREIGFVYQDYVLFPHLNVKENIIFGLKAKKLPQSKIQQKLNNIVETFQITHLLDRYPRTLSGGEQQRVSLARALITSPKIFLLDEPLSALDPHTKEKFQQLLKDIHQKMNMTTIHITHDFNEAMYLADRICVMQNGKVVQIGTPDEIFKKPNCDFVANFVGIENILKGSVNNNKITLCPNINIESPIDKQGDVTVALRSEDVYISKSNSQTKSMNKFNGKVTNIIRKGIISKLNVDIGVNITSVIPSQSLENMDIKLGDNVWASFKESDIHVY